MQNRWLIAIVLTMSLGGVSEVIAAKGHQHERSVERRGPQLAEFPTDYEVQRVAGAREEWDLESGVMRRYFARGDARQVHRELPARLAAEAFLHARAWDFGLDPVRIDRDLEFVFEKPSPSGAHFRWRQTAGGVPVYRSEIVVKVSSHGGVSSVHNNLRVQIEGGFGAAVLDDRDAVRLALAALNARSEDAMGPLSAKLAVVDFSANPRLTYLTSLPLIEPLGDWLVFVDAVNGQVRGVENRALHATGNGRVFNPDPRTRTADSTLVDSNDSDAAVPFPIAYEERPLLDISFDGLTYSLSGPYVELLDFEPPTIAPVTSLTPDFLFERSASGFEDVNVYHHIDLSQRYLQSLGFTNANNRVQQVDPHGLNGADNSHFIVSTHRLAFGEGGVDDAEDADVILHEYGHAIQNDIVPGWGGGQQVQMAEGFCDYWAGSYSYFLYPNFQPHCVFNWDGHNSFWSGRVLVDSTKHYPENCCDPINIHQSGTLWCSGLYSGMLALGRGVMDRLVIDHHYAVGTTGTMAGAAQQILQSDLDLFQGGHDQQLIEIFDYWGFVDKATTIPEISHVPLADTEDSTQARAIVATITGSLALDPAALRVVYGVGAFTDTLVMAATGNPDEYSASIPAQPAGTTVQYYVEAAYLGSGLVAGSPVDAPQTGFYSFEVDVDTIQPAIAHGPLTEVAIELWPALVSAELSDNLGIDDSTALVQWSLNGVAQSSFPLSRVGVTDHFEGGFPSDSSMVSLGDSIAYSIEVADLASVPNVSTSPTMGNHGFEITSVAGRVLVIDDSAGATPEVRRRSANTLTQILLAKTLIVDSQSSSTTDPTTWDNYDLIVSSSGDNQSPMADSFYRDAIVGWVLSGGKLLLEGGDVAFDAIGSPGYPSLAAHAVHGLNQDLNNAGPLQIHPSHLTHPIATTPNALPSTLLLNYQGFGSQDSFEPAPGAEVIYQSTTQPGNAGILVYDDNSLPASAQIVVFAFDFDALIDSQAAAQLVDNVTEFLLASEGPTTGSISGLVTATGAPDPSGTLVVAMPGGHTTLTDASGFYQVSGLVAQTYDVSVNRPGFTNAVQLGVGVGAGETPNVDFSLFPQASERVCVSPEVAIPDNDPTGVASDATISANFPVHEVEVYVEVAHPFVGDLTVDLTHLGTTVRLHDASGGTANHLLGTYPVTLVPDGPGTLDAFDGLDSSGLWTLTVADNSIFTTGTLLEWCLTVRAAADTSSAVDSPLDATLPQFVFLGQGFPNPSSGPTRLHFGLPTAQHVELSVFDVSGRLVRRLQSGQAPAGVHTVRWDGRDQRGLSVGSGVYFYRLQSADRELTQKLVVLR